ncbi:MAG: hypothetical protein JW982_01210 [Spirochaetes bacterium]|nr:hypothetical protein [Spirochaetota bacterium]
MKKLLTAFAIMAASACISAAGNPMISFGIQGTGGMTDVRHTSGDDKADWSQGYSYGGGIFFEKTFTGFFAFHTGIGYTHYLIKYDIPDFGRSSELKLDALKVPVSFNLMFAVQNFSFVIPIGGAYVNILNADQTDTLSTGTVTYDYLYSINSNQFSAFSGLEIRMKTSSAVDFFIGAYGEYFITDLAGSGTSPSDDNLLNYYGKAGIIFRTF